MKVYTKALIVAEEDLDTMQHVNNIRYLQWVQDVAEEHWDACVPKIIKDQYVWVVLSHHIEYKNAALKGDRILLKTYVKESRGARSTRIVEIYQEDTSKLITKADTVWCLLDRKNKKPARIPDTIYNLFH